MLVYLSALGSGSRMKLAVRAVIIFSTLFAPHGGHAQGVVQGEAERALKEIDCEILISSGDVERLGEDLRVVNQRFSQKILTTTEASKVAKEKATGLLSTVTGSMIEKGLSMLVPEASALPQTVGRPSLAAKHFRAAEAISQRIKMWKTNYDLARDIVDTMLSAEDMKFQQANMIQVSREMDFVSEQLATAEASAEKLLSLRNSTEDAFTVKGAKLEGRYFGEACGKSNMDGVWQTEYRRLNMQTREDVIEIRDTSFRYDSGTSNVTATCGVFEGTVSYGNDGTATGVIRKKCDDMNVIIGFEFRKIGDGLESRVCQTFSYNTSYCDIPSNSNPINMVKIED